MIQVQLNERNYEYDIHSLVKAFFPKEEVQVSAEVKVLAEPPSFFMEIIYGHEPDEILIRLNGEKQRQIPVEYKDRPETKNRLKQALYETLSAYTKVMLPWGTLTGIRPTKIPMAFLQKGKSEDWIRRYMKEMYFASEEKIGLCLEVAKREAALLKRLDYQKGYSLYLGIPFCPSTCLYCSFTSYPLGVWESRVEEYLKALEQEILFTADIYREKKLNTVYIGGGTPTTLTPKQLDWLLTRVEETFSFDHLLEYTVEAGRPDSITEEKLEVLRQHGISRISINPQTMKQATLDLIGRRHTVEQTVESFRLARKMGFDNINMDLIVGLPEEDLSDVSRTMEQIKALEPDSLTVHSLAIKRASRLRMNWEAYEDLSMVNTWEIIRLTAQAAREMRLSPYYLYRQKNMAGNFENVGYAREGAEGLYNILIMEEVQTIVACGAGSISKRVYPDGRIERCENVKDVALYLQKIDEMIERKRKLLTDF